MVDPVTGAFIGWLCGKLGDSMLQHLIGSPELARDIDKEIAEWARSLPEDRYVDPKALFPEADPSTANDERPEYFALQEKLVQNVLPDKQMWHAVFTESWRWVKNNVEEPQPFFNLQESEASKELERLAQIIYDVCVQYEKIFKKAVIGKLDDANAYLKGIARDIREMKEDKKTEVSSQGECGRLEISTSFVGKEQELKQLTDAIVEKFATSEVIKAAVEYASVEPIIDIPPQVQHVSTRKETVSRIISQFDAYTWIALTGTVGSGKTQLAILLAQEVGRCKAWVSLRDKEEIACRYLDQSMDLVAGRSISVSGRERYKIAIQALSSGDLIVIDDTPPLDGNQDISNRLLFLLEECASKNVKVISTSTCPLGGKFSSSAGGRLKVLAVPAFTESEVSDVLQGYGATQENAGKWSSSVCALSYGHPVLVVALGRYLQNLNWKVSSLEQFESLFIQNAYATEINNDTTRRLIDTVQDGDTREFLYRLNLAMFGFDLEDVKRVASVKPPVSRPVERLTSLDGLWVQRTSDESYTVSPLIRRLGSDDVPLKQKRAIWYLLGTRILTRRNLNVWDVSHIVGYFMAAGTFQNALVILSQGLHVLSQQETLHDDALLGLLWASTHFPSNVDLSLRIFVRSLQINVNTKLGRDVTFEVVDLGNLVQSAESTNGWSVPLAGMELARRSELYAQHWQIIHNVIAKTISLFPEVVAPDGRKLTSMITMGPEALIWLVIPNILAVEQLRGWARLLEALPPDALEKAFAIPEADGCCIEISHRVWIEEAKKDENSRQWQHVLDCFDELSIKAEALGLHFLWACANRAKMIIHAEYLDDLETARKIGEETLDIGAQDTRIRTIVKEYLGHQYYYQRKLGIARGWLEETIAEETRIHPFGRLRSLIYLSAIIGEENPSRAQELVKESVNLAKTATGILELDLVSVLSEQAISTWLFARDVSAAFDSFDEAVERLLQCRRDNVFWKAAFVRLAHVGMYFESIASRGEPPIVDGKPCDPPFRGMFFRGTEEKLAERFKEERVWAIMAEVALFAASIQNNERAAKWAWRALDSARSAGCSHAIGPLVDVLVLDLIQRDKYRQVLDMALECSYSGTAATKLIREGKYSTEMSLDVDAVLGSKPGDIWSQAEHESALLSLLPIAFRILSISLDNEQLASDHANEVSAICKQISITASSIGFWQIASDIFSGLYNDATSATDLIKIANEARKQGYDVLAIVCYMFTSAKSDYDLKHKVYAQLMAMPYVCNVLKKLPSIYRVIILPFVERYWTREIQDRGFLFSGPKIVEQRLKESDRIPEGFRAQYILREVIAGLRMRIPKKDLPSWLYEKPKDNK